jgi:hypothetical protein
MLQKCTFPVSSAQSYPITVWSRSSRLSSLIHTWYKFPRHTRYQIQFLVQLLQQVVGGSFAHGPSGGPGGPGGSGSGGGGGSGCQQEDQVIPLLQVPLKEMMEVVGGGPG